MKLTGNDAVDFLKSMRHPDEKQREKLKEISKNITLRDIPNEYEADINGLDMSFLKVKEKLMNINIEYKIKPYFTKDTLMSFLCKDINYIDTDKAKNYVEGYLSKIPVQILKAFDSENWKIIITNEDLKEKFGFTYDIYGVTDYDTKTIYTYASEDAIQYGLGHEIGHFVDMYMGDLSQTLEWGKLVKTINPQCTPVYYFTLGNDENKGLEYFADSFLLYINDKLLLTKCSLEVSKFWDRLFDYLDDILKVISENTIKPNIFTSPSDDWSLSD